MPPVSARTRRFSLRCRIEVRITLAAWAIAQANTGARRNFTPLPGGPTNSLRNLGVQGAVSRSGGLVSASFQLVETGGRLGEKTDGPLVRGDQLLERGCAARQLGDGLLEGGEQFLEARGLDWACCAHVLRELGPES